jgi:phosphate:Na+ symporter
MAGECNGEACVIYTEMLTDFERLGDHMLNIAQAVNISNIEELRLPQGARDSVSGESSTTETEA